MHRKPVVNGKYFNTTADLLSGQHILVCDPRTSRWSMWRKGPRDIDLIISWDGATLRGRVDNNWDGYGYLAYKITDRQVGMILTARVLGTGVKEESWEELARSIAAQVMENRDA